MRVQHTTPEPTVDPVTPVTPHDRRSYQIMNDTLRSGEISPTTAYGKMAKAYEKSQAENVLLQKDLEKWRAADELDKAARGSNKRTRFPQGHLFDQKYQEDHAEELQERKEAEKEGRAKKRRAAAAKGKGRASALVESSEAGPSNTMRED